MPGFEWINKEEKEAISQIFDEGGVLFAHGFDTMREHFHVREFEVACRDRFKTAECLAVSSGTAAIKIALKALGVSHGDEVITQAFNFIATVEAILDCGAVPVIANVDDTLNMDERDLRSLITSKTKVILPVHMLGVSARMKEILSIASDNGLPLLEDSCESVGATYEGRPLGSLADAGAMSFDHGKMITTGEGGLVLSNNLEIATYAREYHDHGHENNLSLPRGRDSRTIFGFNYRMTEMQAAVGKVQLGKLDKMLEENWKRYDALQSGMGGKFQLREVPDQCKPTCDTLIFLEVDRKIRESVISLLATEGFGTKNLPDAMEWHCTAFWDHALSQEQVSRSHKTRVLLEQAIAIPIWLRKSVDDYIELGSLLSKLK